MAYNYDKMGSFKEMASKISSCKHWCYTTGNLQRGLRDNKARSHSQRHIKRSLSKMCIFKIIIKSEKQRRIESKAFKFEWECKIQIR